MVADSGVPTDGHDDLLDRLRAERRGYERGRAAGDAHAANVSDAKRKQVRELREQLFAARADADRLATALRELLDAVDGVWEEVNTGNNMRIRATWYAASNTLAAHEHPA